MAGLAEGEMVSGTIAARGRDVVGESAPRSLAPQVGSLQPSRADSCIVLHLEKAGRTDAGVEATFT